MTLSIQLEKRLIRYLKSKFTGLTICDAKDAIQDAYLQFYLLSDERKAEISNRSWWLFKVAVRYANRIMKKKKKNVYLCDSYDFTFLVEKRFIIDPEEEQKRKQLLDYVQLLPSSMRIAVYKHYVEGFTYKEIASMNYKTEESIKKCAQRGLTLVRKNALEDLSAFYE